MNRLCSDCLTEGARLNPQGIAVESGERKITYSELQKSLIFPIAGKEPVALWAEKSIEGVAAILGIQAAGRICVPIDPLNPVERALTILRDSGAEELFISKKLLGKFEAILKKEMPGLVLSELGVGSSFDVLERQSARELAYLLYTSGSTGTPKGVMVSNRAAMTFIDWSRETFLLSSLDRVASFAPFHFDLSLFDLYASLSAGATICLCPREVLVFPESTLDWISESKITTLYTTPSVLASFAACEILGRLSSLKRILFAGEVMPPKILAALMNAVPSAEFFNLYGPTETNVCTYYKVDRPYQVGADVPIGKPCLYNRVEIVGLEGQPVGPGVLGEVQVEGPNVMSGYWNSQIISGAYLTGDYGWKDESGLLHFHGRKDAMLKVSGYRIEPAEIEAVLQSHPNVRQAAIFKKNDQTREILAAAVVLETPSDEAELRSYCGNKLPPYMIPMEFEFYSDLPLNANGKIDRGALTNGK